MERDNSRSYVFTHLKQNTTYTVSVAARNSVDIGPVVVKDITTTPIEKCKLKKKEIKLNFELIKLSICGIISAPTGPGSLPVRSQLQQHHSTSSESDAF